MNQALLTQHVASIREQAAAWLIDTAQLKRKSGVTHTRGAALITYDTPVDIACRFINRSGNDEVPVASQFRAAQQKTNTALYRMQVAYDVEVTQDDIIIFNDTEFEIVYVPEVHSLMGSKVLSLLRKT